MTPPGVAFDALPAIDLVIVTHNHYDHLDLVALKRLVQVHAPRILTPLGNDTIIRRASRMRPSRRWTGAMRWR